VEIQTLRLEPGGPTWPKELSEVEDPPSVLWARGRLELLARKPRVAVVGSRSPSPYGEAQAERFGEALARAGVVVVSGLARGVDQAAHAGALAANGATLAVLGCGVDRPWPPGPITQRMLEEGLVLSEYRPGTPPRRHHFPLRNRLISALSVGVLVVEGAWASGSLITARWAADQGRTVFALPGRVDHPMARGTLRLIREGATPVESPEQLLDDLLGPLGGGVPRSAPTTAELPPDDPQTAALIGALRGETSTADELATRLERPLPGLLAQLIELEFAGRVARAPGGLYRLRR